MQGSTHDGLYKFSPMVPNKDGSSPSANNTYLRSSSGVDDAFELWHRRLGHPASHIVNSVLK